MEPREPLFAPWVPEAGAPDIGPDERALIMLREEGHPGESRRYARDSEARLQMEMDMLAMQDERARAAQRQRLTLLEENNAIPSVAMAIYQVAANADQYTVFETSGTVYNEMVRLCRDRETNSLAIDHYMQTFLNATCNDEYVPMILGEMQPRTLHHHLFYSGEEDGPENLRRILDRQILDAIADPDVTQLLGYVTPRLQPFAALVPTDDDDGEHDRAIHAVELPSRDWELRVADMPSIPGETYTEFFVRALGLGVADVSPDATHVGELVHTHEQWEWLTQCPHRLVLTEHLGVDELP